MGSYDELITAMSVVQDCYTAICEELGDDQLWTELARAIFMHLRPIAKHINGVTFAREIQMLSGVETVEALGDHYPSLLA
jgi:hypothetical protein